MSEKNKVKTLPGGAAAGDNSLGDGLREAYQADASQDGYPDPAERGGTRVSRRTVERVAAMAINHIEGIRRGGSGYKRSFGEFVSDARGVERSDLQGIQVLEGDAPEGVQTVAGLQKSPPKDFAVGDSVTVAVTVAVHYGRSIPQISEAVRSGIIQAVENLTGLAVPRVDITVGDVVFPQNESNGQGNAGGQRALESGNTEGAARRVR